ncbi:MAG: hypothetical protein JXM70_17435 [Pirellulales bacterium]|nr:hypothetical protein [Pirellulales bacterium]
MWRFCLLSLIVIGWPVFAGCQGDPPKPKPATAEEKREMETQMQNVDAEERAQQQRSN